MAQLAKVSQRSSLLMNFLRLNTRAFSTPVESSKPTEKSNQNTILSNKTHKGNEYAFILSSFYDLENY